jgi:hypothetical protein
MRVDAGKDLTSVVGDGSEKSSEQGLACPRIRHPETGLRFPFFPGLPALAIPHRIRRSVSSLVYQAYPQRNE